MNKVKTMKAIVHGLKAVSFALICKAVVAFSIGTLVSVVTLALLGVVLRLLSINPPPTGDAAVIGGVIGAVIALQCRRSDILPSSASL